MTEQELFAEVRRRWPQALYHAPSDTLRVGVLQFTYRLDAVMVSVPGVPSGIGTTLDDALADLEVELGRAQDLLTQARQALEALK